MRGAHHGVATAALLATLLISRTGGAEPIVIPITGGIAGFSERGSNTIAIIGAQGLSLRSFVSSTFLLGCLDPRGPGERWTVGAQAGGIDFEAHVSFRGVSYEHLGTLTSTAGASVTLRSTLVLPPTSAGPVVVTNPFTFSGLFSNDEPRFTVELVGSGTAMIDLWPAGSLDSPLWDPRRAVFEFSSVAPTPEPTSFVLMGAAASLVTASRRWRKRNSTHR